MVRNVVRYWYNFEKRSKWKIIIILDMTWFTISQTAILLGVSSASLRRWDTIKYLIAHRTAGNHRRYEEREIQSFLARNPYKRDRTPLISLFHPQEDSENLDSAVTEGRMPYIYARVSGTHQVQEGNLTRQVEHLVSKVKQILGNDQQIHVIQECGSGINPDRPGIRRLISAVQKEKVTRIYVAYRDRLTRFGFSFLESWFQEHHVTITELDGHSEEESPESQLTTDLMALLASFSGKLYKHRSLVTRGLRVKKTPQELEEIIIHQCLEKEIHRAWQSALKLNSS
jgi:predicted site-specific integrase-resolvase